MSFVGRDFIFYLSPSWLVIFWTQNIYLRGQSSAGFHGLYPHMIDRHCPPVADLLQYQYTDLPRCIWGTFPCRAGQCTLRQTSVSVQLHPHTEDILMSHKAPPPYPLPPPPASHPDLSNIHSSMPGGLLATPPPATNRGGKIRKCTQLSLAARDRQYSLAGK